MNTARMILAGCAALLVSATSAHAAPSFAFVDNNDGSVTLQVVPDSDLLPSALATEAAIVITASGVDLTGASIADSAIWDTETPGDNPFISGSPVGGDSFGLWLDNLSANQIFISYGSGVVATADPTALLNITYEGVGTIEASGLIAQAGQLFDGLSASVDVIPEPATAGLVALAAVLAAVRRVD